MQKQVRDIRNPRRWLALAAAIREPSVRACKLVLLAVTIGVADDLQVRFVSFAKFGVDVETTYQAIFMIASAAGAYFILRKRDWSVARNLSNLLMAVPVAAIADNVSIDAGTLKLYFISIPTQGYAWRKEVFGHTAALSSVAQLVNQQSVAPGIIDGYVAAIGIAISYVVLQYSLYRRFRIPARASRGAFPEQK